MKEIKYILIFLLSVIPYNVNCQDSIQLKNDTVNLKLLTLNYVKSNISDNGNKIIMKIGQDAIFLNKTVKDLLIYMPKVNLIDDKISINGKSNVLYLIDGRESSLDISTLSSSRIDRIELVSNSSSKYDVKYDAVFNIILKPWERNGIEGYFLYNNSISNKRLSQFGSNSLTVSNKKLSLNLNYSLNHENNDFRSFGKQSFTNYSYNFNNRSLASRKVNYFGISPVYKINQNQKVGFDIGYTDIVNYTPSRNVQNFLSDSTIFSDVNKREVSKDYTTSIFYELTSKKFNLDTYFYYYRNEKNGLRSLNGYNNDTYIFNFLNNNSNKANSYIYNLNLSINLNDKDILYSGFRLNFINGNYHQNILNNDINDVTYFDYKESVLAHYVEWDKYFGKFNLYISNRTEYFSRIINFSNLLSSNYINKDQLQLFPSIYLSYKLNNNNHKLNISATKKINRVGFSELIPYNYFINFNEVINGNPNLKNHIKYNLELDYSFKKNLFITYYFSYNKNSIQSLTALTDEVINYLPVNYDYKIQGISASYVKNVKKWWYLNAKIAIEKNINSDKIEDISFDNRNFSFNGNLTNQFSSKKLGALIIQNIYSSPTYFDFYKISKGFKTDIKYQKSILKNQLSLSFTIKDVFNTFYNKTESTTDDFTSVINRNYGWQQFIFSASYNFTKGIGKTRKTAIKSTENERLNF